MDATQQIQLFSTLFYVCLAVAVIGFGLALFFFFFFDIRSVYALMTGKAKRQTIERMAEQNSKTGRLAVSDNIKAYTEPITQEPAPAAAVSEDTVTLNVSAETTILQPEAAETMVLGGGVVAEDAAETMVLGGGAVAEEAGETAVLSNQPTVNEANIRFEITESTLVIHTAEII